MSKPFSIYTTCWDEKVTLSYSFDRIWYPLSHIYMGGGGGQWSNGIHIGLKPIERSVFEPRQRHYVVFQGKTPYSHSGQASYWGRAGVENTLVASCRFVLGKPG